MKQARDVERTHLSAEWDVCEVLDWVNGGSEKMQRALDWVLDHPLRWEVRGELGDTVGDTIRRFAVQCLAKSMT